MALAIQTLVKQPSESRVFEFDFGAKLSSGESLNGAAVSVAPSGLTLGAPAYSGNKAQIRISGGTAGVTYKLTAVVNTSLSNILEEDGNLKVIAK